MSEPGGPSGAAVPVKRGEPAWKEATERIAKRNEQAHKAGKHHRDAYERQRAEKRQNAERRDMAEALAKLPSWNL
jgi:hypothetical protein